MKNCLKELYQKRKETYIQLIALKVITSASGFKKEEGTEAALSLSDRLQNLFEIQIDKLTC